MIPLDYILAIAILSTPPDQTITDPERFATVRPTIQAVAVGMELMDEREQRYVLRRPDDLAGDTKLIRHRYADLHDAPPLSDHMQFPDRALVTDMLSFNRAYRQHLDNRQSLELTYWWELRDMLQEVDRLYTVWDTVRDAKCEYYYVTVRRQALKKLREMVGDEAYYSGALPAHVPVWRFAHID